MLRTPALLLLLAPLLLQLAEGCGRTPVTKPQGEEDVTVVTPTEDTELHRDNCTDQEVNTQGCLQGGTCFAVVIDSIRVLNCQCPDNYIGTRCELFDFHPDSQGENKDRIATAGVAVLTVAGVLFVTVLIFIGVWRKRYLRKKRSENEKDKEKLQDPLKSNGSPSESESSSSSPRKNGSLNNEQLEPFQGTIGKVKGVPV
ncbi:pro-neuregulin-2, membrane-bound isoform-like [Ylistrum balloti]|uniref:pro-neuregulin-2, membrane-bound isoform-like n=1 Tax=Ylistrum balloti TaxID=509963 RepID=UPI002905AC35|nr:pro-neuregulin-2, membrane-bound isoform-like [Ylistrum balloti]XP_060064141.1 pro-neuregulin-2, membrane-bound isoform-like [Ylistrum balloti]